MNLGDTDMSKPMVAIWEGGRQADVVDFSYADYLEFVRNAQDKNKFVPKVLTWKPSLEIERCQFLFCVFFQNNKHRSVVGCGSAQRVLLAVLALQIDRLDRLLWRMLEVAFFET